jgi:hypothetical protein
MNERPNMAHRTIQVVLVCCSLFISAPLLSGQVSSYVGVIAGVATLSADAGSERSVQGLSLSSYDPRNGGAINVFAGAYWRNYFAFQGNYIGNRNSLQLNSTSSNGVFHQEDRSSSQQAVVFDFLIYFRHRSSRIRPYLGTGTGILHLSSTLDQVVASGGAATAPPAQFSYTGPLLRSHVGIDLRLARRLDFRYSFSEIIAHNNISQRLSPPGTHDLMNFQNLFGFVFRP